jgi:hypothetical protein
MHPHRFAQSKATISTVAVAMLAALSQLLAAEAPETTEITLEEAKTLVRTVKAVAHEFQSRHQHGLALDPPATTDKCPYFMLKAWIDVPDTASTLIGWYRVNKRNADVWEDPPYKLVNDPPLAAAQARLRQKHHISDTVAKQARDLPSWEADCLKFTD